MIDSKSRPVVEPHFPAGSVGWIKALTKRMLGSPVQTITAPGGQNRSSVRLALEDGRSVIATRRPSVAQMEKEVQVLSRLGMAGAAVPVVLGFREGLLLQEDLGRNRLSSAMAQADAQDRADLGRAALTSLEQCRSAMASDTDWLAEMPGLGTRPGWSEELVSHAVFLSGDLGVAAPEVDFDRFAEALTQRPSRFLRWNARLGSATLRPDGTVAWYNWSLFGRRAGVEDVSWVISDDYWQLDRDTTEALLADFVPDADQRALVRRMAIALAVARLARIREKVAVDGWSDPGKALREDRLATVPAVVEDLCARLSDLARDDHLLAGYVPWFREVGHAMVGRQAATR